MLVASGDTAFSPVLSTIHAQCFDKPWSEQEMFSLLSLPTTVGWLTEQGFLLCSHVADEMEILTIGVLPTFRKQGVGIQLLQTLFSYASDKKVSHIFLEVSADNLPAQHLYQKAGFIQTGLRKNYYKTATGFTDALCLTKTI
jgi:ribosomal-protein-alanine N-acetyltransferase